MSDAQPDLESVLYPPLEPYRQEMLDVGDGHRLYCEQSGNPEGQPVVCLHGGPGSGSNPTLRRFLDPQRYRIIVYDQRGTGRSTPAGELQHNDTAALVRDLEAIRAHLGIQRWLLFGGSWGATLAIVYAQAHAECVQGMILRGPLLGRQCDLDWFFGPYGVARIFRKDYQAFLAALPAHLRTSPLVGYQSLLGSTSEETRLEAARTWASWDHRIATGRVRPKEAEASPMRYAIACHYAVNGFFLPDDGVLGDIHKLAGIPGVLIQGQRDLVCPAEGAVTLSEHWRELDLQLVENAGHLAMEPAIAAALVKAARDFR